MTFPEIIKTITNIEQNVDVQNIRCSSIRIWPLIRLQIWQQLSSPDSWSTPPKSKRNNTGKHVQRVLGALLRPNHYKKSDVLFLVGPNERRVQVGGAYYSQFADSLNDVASDLGLTTSVLDLDDKKSPTYGEPIRLSRDIGSIWQKVANRLVRQEPELHSWSELISYLKKNHPNIRLDGAGIVRDVRSIQFNERRFERILKRARPKIGFLVCYYHPAAMGYIRACRKMGIKTIEIQHGQQGDYHGMYTNWTNLPEDGYDVMPTHFWCWGQQSADRINAWLPRQRAFVGGNPWLANHSKHTRKVQRTDGKQHILLQIQPNPEPILPFVVETILASPPEFQWHIGLHPAVRGREGEIRTALGKAVNRTDFDLERTTPLYDVFNQMDFLLTQWSTVAYEALAFNVHPVIVHPNGRDIFRDYINKGIFSYASTTADLLKIIGEDSSKYSVREEEPYIVSDIAHVKEALNKCIAS